MNDQRLNDAGDLLVSCVNRLSHAMRLINQSMHGSGHTMTLIRASNSCRKASEHVCECMKSIETTREEWP